MVPNLYLVQSFKRFKLKSFMNHFGVISSFIIWLWYNYRLIDKFKPFWHLTRYYQKFPLLRNIFAKSNAKIISLSSMKKKRNVNHVPWILWSSLNPHKFIYRKRQTNKIMKSYIKTWHIKSMLDMNCVITRVYIFCIHIKNIN